MASTYNCDCEKWFDIPKWEGIYQISNYFRFKSLARQVRCRGGLFRTIKETILSLNYTGLYPTVGFWKNNINHNLVVHRIVAALFIPNPHKKKYINHKNGNKQDFSIENLEWCTLSENSQHAYDTGLLKPYSRSGEDNPKSKLTIDKVRKIRYCVGTGKFEHQDLALIFNISRTTIYDIVNGRSWKNIV